MQQSLRDPSTYELVGLLVQHALDVAPSLTPQGLANTMYGIAVLGWPLTEQQTEYFLAQVSLTSLVAWPLLSCRRNWLHRLQAKGS